MKRVAAADFSRQLSKKVFLGQARVTTIGHWRGGTAVFGMRRMLVGEDGKPKMRLRFGQSKGLKTDYVVLVPGPQSEIKIVREIFAAFASKRKTRTEIADSLNARGIKNARGLPWSWLTIDNMLKNEVYLGHLVYNRTSAKLGERVVRNPRDMWVRRNNAFKPIVSSELFEKAQIARREQAAGRKKTDKELLDRLRNLLRKKGRLTAKIMQAAKDVPSDSVYVKRFGSLVSAYKRIGFVPHRRYWITEIKDAIDNTICAVADKLTAELEKRQINVTFLPELRLLTINHGLTVGMAVARSIADGARVSSGRWEVRKRKYTRADLTLIVRMSPSNTKVLDYFLLPTRSFPIRYGDRLKISDLHFGAFQYSDLQGLLRALTEWIGTRTSAAS